MNALETIRSIGEMISKIHQTDPLLKFFIRFLIEKLGYQRSMIVLKRKEEPFFLVQEQGGFSECQVEKIRQKGIIFFNKILEQNQVKYFAAESSCQNEIGFLFESSSLVAIPIKSQWVLVVGNNGCEQSLKPQDVEIISAIAAQASIALEMIELYEQLRQERDQLRQAKTNIENQAKLTIRTNLELSQKETRLTKKLNEFSLLYTIGELIGRTRKVKELLKVVAEALLMRLDYDRSLIILLTPEGAIIEAQAGFLEKELEVIEDKFPPFISKTNITKKAVLMTVRTQGKEIEQVFGCTSLVIVPLREQEFLLAGKRIIYDAVTADDMESLSILGGQVKIAVENVLLYQELLQERDQLQQVKRDLVEWSRILEQRVEERTRKLQEAQKHLVRADKLAAIGQLGAGVAHELNNPIGGILGYAQLLVETAEQVKELELKDKLVRYAQTIEKESQRCRQTVEGLLRFSRGTIQEKPVFKKTQLKEILQSTLALIGCQLEMHQIKIYQEIEPDLPPVNVYPDQIQQVFINVILNAEQAMPSGGELRITARKSADKAEMVAVGIKDTGYGIAPENLNKIFDPFFTTKPIGKGTGLGLSISYGIIQNHHGQIAVTSQLNKGTQIAIFLPMLTDFSNNEGDDESGG